MTVLSYVSKVFDYISQLEGGNPREVSGGAGADAVKNIEEAVKGFKQALVERDRDPYKPGFTEDYDLRLLEYALGELKFYFENTDNCHLKPDDARIFTHFIRREIEEFKKSAEG